MSDWSLKKCTRCKKDLPKLAFAASKNEPDELHKWCRECKARYDLDRRAKKKQVASKMFSHIKF